MSIKLRNVISIVEYGFALFLILALNSVYFRTIGAMPKLIKVGLLGFALILSIYGLYRLKKENKDIKRIFIFLFYFAIYMGGLWVLSQSRGYTFTMNQLLTLIIFPILILPILYYQKKDQYSVLIKIYRVVLILAIFSLMGWLLNIFHVHTNYSIYVGWGTARMVNGYFGLSFFPQAPVIFLGIFMPRNTSIFIESPMFAYVLIIAITIRLFLVKNKNRLTGLLLIFTVLTTTSSTALLFLVFVYLVAYLSKLGVKINKLFLVFMAIVLGAIFCVFIFYIFQQKKNNMSGSYNLRLDDLMAGLQAWSLHPFIGNGINNNTVITEFMNSVRWFTDNTGYSLGLLLPLVYTGIYGVLMYIFPLLTSKNNKSILILNVVNLLLLLIVIVPYDYLCIFIVMVGIGEWIFKEGKYK